MEEDPTQSEQLTEAEARAIMSGGLGQAELEFVTSISSPLYWTRHTGAEITTRNGTAFFLDAGEGVFGVTAAHVIEGWRNDTEPTFRGPLVLGGNGKSVRLDWAERVIDECPTIDIATFKLTHQEVTDLGKVVLTGSQREWPPAPPHEDRGVYYCGYPGVGTRRPSRLEAVFGAVPGAGVASSVSERDVSTVLDRRYMIPVFSDGLPPENFDFRGMSGGPMLTVVQNTLRSWRLAGVIYQGPNTDLESGEAIAGLEIIKARRAHYIRPDGTLDRGRWV